MLFYLGYPSVRAFFLEYRTQLIPLHAVEILEIAAYTMRFLEYPCLAKLS